jgi:hypothetical protein
MPVNWEALNRRAAELRLDDVGLLADDAAALADEAIDVTCELIEGLGVDAHPAELEEKFEEARNGIQRFVELALMGLHMTASGVVVEDRRGRVPAAAAIRGGWIEAGKVLGRAIADTPEFYLEDETPVLTEEGDRKQFLGGVVLGITEEMTPSAGSGAELAGLGFGPTDEVEEQ